MQLSASSLSIFKDCKRCFFLDKKMKAPRPRGIFSSLPGGIDGILKKRLDEYRGTLSPDLEDERLNGWVLFKDRELLAKRRQWNASDLKYKDAKGNVLVGAVDDILETESGDLVAPFDVKTKGSAPDQAYCEKYYQNQLDIYAFLLSQKHDVADFGVLFYFWPVDCADYSVKFESGIFLLDVSAKRGKALFDNALEVLAQDELPDADPGCEYCKCHGVRSEAMMKALAGGK